MKFLTWTAGLWGLWALVACGSPVTTTPATQDSEPGVATLPTAANLEGTWSDTATVSHGFGGTDQYLRRVTYGPAGAWLQRSETIATPASGPPTHSYGETEGTFRVSGDVLICAATRHRGSSAPLTDADSWINDDPTSAEFQVTAFLYLGKLYANPRYPTYRAEGGHTGLVGTWAAVQSSTPTSWYRYVYEFQSTGAAEFRVYSSASSTFGDPIATSTSQYSLPSAGQMMFTVEGISGTQPYLQVGDYFLTGSEAALGGATRD